LIYDILFDKNFGEKTIYNLLFEKLQEFKNEIINDKQIMWYLRENIEIFYYANIIFKKSNLESIDEIHELLKYIYNINESKN
jgi:hypothetical protein